MSDVLTPFYDTNNFAGNRYISLSSDKLIPQSRQSNTILYIKEGNCYYNYNRCVFDALWQRVYHVMLAIWSITSGNGTPGLGADTPSLSRSTVISCEG